MHCKKCIASHAYCQLSFKRLLLTFYDFTLKHCCIMMQSVSIYLWTTNSTGGANYTSMTCEALGKMFHACIKAPWVAYHSAVTCQCFCMIIQPTQHVQFQCCGPSSAGAQSIQVSLSLLLCVSEKHACTTPVCPLHACPAAHWM